ncbi:MAG: glycoside hydrolase [Capsulimonadaceae bacterium]|nr:glycoside hydrolase [Capsulimonadaceae bacterium]
MIPQCMDQLPTIALATIVALIALAVQPAEATPTTLSHEGGAWTLQNNKLKVDIDCNHGWVSVLDRASGHVWQQPAALAGISGSIAPAASPEDKFRNVEKVPASKGSGVQFEANLGPGHSTPPVQVSITLEAGSTDLVVVTDVAARDQKVSSVNGLESFVLDSANGVLAVADYCDGHLYPLDAKPFPIRSSDGGRLDMPWIGLCDLDKGYGYSLTLDTSDDATINYNDCTVAARTLICPQVVWKPCMGTFNYPRRVIYHFAPAGGYVVLAHAYRDYATKLGLIVPFTEKIKRNPNIARLFGAPDVWGNATLKFARQAKLAGVDKMLIHGQTNAADMQTIDDIGYLTSEYDNYDDIQPIDDAHKLDSNHDLIPDHVVLKADGTRMTAWLTWDKKIQYMKRCPSFWVASAQAVVPDVLKAHPFLGRFIDVATAEALYECYDPAHPLTRAQKRQCGVDLSAYMSSQHLVVGGEHGIWWAPMHEDYIEGMMSGGHTSWPAGYLIRPKTKDEPFTWPSGQKLSGWDSYEQLGIGHKWRAPLWELVFHDCVVSTWYWGDSSDYLLTAAPEITPKKDAYNVLYGTIPLMWANKEGSWTTARDVFLRTYRNTCKMHQAVALSALVDHQFLTADHDVQSTRFADGTRTIVNFGETPYRATLDGLTYLLPQNGWVAIGPKIRQSLALEDGKPVTTIEAPGYRFNDHGGFETTLRQEGTDRVIVNQGPAATPVRVDLNAIQPNWDAKTTLGYLLDENGQRTSPVTLGPVRHGTLVLPAAAETQVYEIVCRSGGATPFLP